MFAKALINLYKKVYGWLGLVFSLPVLIKLKKKFDYKNNAGALVIGLAAPAVKTHGSADCKQFLSSIRLLYDTVANDTINKIKKEFK